MSSIPRKKSISSTITPCTDSSLNALSNASNENFMQYLKEFYDYDEVSLHTCEKNNKEYDLNIFDDALHFICLSVYGDYMKDQYAHFKNKITNYFDVLKIVKLTHNYERHSVSHYLIIDSYFNKENEYKIIIPHDCNALNLLKIKAMTIKPIDLPYEDFNMFFEFKEIKHKLPTFDVSNFYFETVLDINLEVQTYPPILKGEETKSHYGFKLSIGDYTRKAQIIIRHYPENVANEDNYILDIKLVLGDYLIKSETIKDIIFVNDLNETIAKFIFPLAEHVDFLNEQNLKPELTKEFMDQDFSDFWNLHLMSQI
jgi:hypothetical protein